MAPHNTAPALEALRYWRDLGLPYALVPLCSHDHAGMWSTHVSGDPSKGRPACASPGKCPLVPRWQDLIPAEGASCIEHHLAHGRPINVGLVLGRGLVALDVDGDGGEHALAAVSRSDLPATWESRSGSGHGRHLIYSVPKDHPCPRRLVTRAAGHEELLVLGRGSQVVLPPSIHATGGTYAWAPGHAPHEIPIAPAPAWLLDILRGAPAVHQTTGPLLPTLPPGSDVLAWAMGQTSVPQDAGHQALVGVAARLRAAGADEGRIVDVLRVVRTARARDPGEIESIARWASSTIPDKHHTRGPWRALADGRVDELTLLHRVNSTRSSAATGYDADWFGSAYGGGGYCPRGQTRAYRGLVDRCRVRLDLWRCRNGACICCLPYFLSVQYRMALAQLLASGLPIHRWEVPETEIKDTLLRTLVKAGRRAFGEIYPGLWALPDEGRHVIYAACPEPVAGGEIVAPASLAQRLAEDLRRITPAGHVARRRRVQGFGGLSLSPPKTIAAENPDEPDMELVGYGRIEGGQTTITRLARGAGLALLWCEADHPRVIARGYGRLPDPRLSLCSLLGLRPPRGHRMDGAPPETPTRPRRSTAWTCHDVPAAQRREGCTDRPGEYEA